MSATPPSPLLRRVPPGGWMALVWLTATAYHFTARLDEWRYWNAPVHRGPLLDFLFGHSPGNAASLLLAAALVLCAVPRRRKPLSALAFLLVGTVMSTMGMSVGDIPLVQFLAVDMLVCFIAATRSRRTSVTGAAMALAVAVGYAVTRVVLAMPITTSNTVIVTLMTVVAWLIGNSIHENHVHADALRAQAAAQAVTAERLRIARELHDMVAHSIGVIAIQAGVGSRVIDTQPAEARNALSAIEATSRETLSGLRRMLGVLRRAEPGQEQEHAPLDPAPGLADIERLAETTAGAGVGVEVRWLGDRRPLPPEIELSAFRITQEALTNVVRHSGTHTCRVSIDYQDEELAIEIVDDGRGPAATGGGYGITGMRERVALLHGRFTAGPRPEGGFRVAVVLPLPVEAVR